jgi:hypothetical protein
VCGCGWVRRGGGQEGQEQADAGNDWGCSRR